jgi:hypothetical protein
MRTYRTGAITPARSSGTARRRRWPTGSGADLIDRLAAHLEAAGVLTPTSSRPGPGAVGGDRRGSQICR